MDALAAADDVAVRMIDTSVVRVTSTEFVSRGAEKNMSAGREAGLPARFTLSWTPPRLWVHALINPSVSTPVLLTLVFRG